MSNDKRLNASLTGPKKGTVKGRPQLTINGKLHEQAKYAIQNLTDVKACSLSGDGGYEVLDLTLAFIERIPTFKGFNPTSMANEVVEAMTAALQHVRAHPEVIGSALAQGANPIHDLLINDSMKAGIATAVQPEDDSNAP